jgi:pullulanase
VENSFNSPDSINAIDWGLKAIHRDVYDYVKTLVAMRRSHPAFRMKSREQIVANLRFLEADHGLIRYTINGAALSDPWKEIYVAFNASDSSRPLIVPEGSWRPHIVNNKKANSRKIPRQIAAHSAVILYRP